MCDVIEFIGAMDDGGAQTLVKDYAYLLNKKGYECAIVTVFNTPNAANTKLAVSNNTRIIPIFEKHTLVTRVFKKLCGWFYIPYKLNKIIATEQPDCLHVHLAYLRFLKPIAQNLKGIKLLYTCHSLPKRLFDGENKIEYECARFLIKNNNLQLIGLHDQMVDELNEMFGVKNSVVIHNGIDFERFQKCEVAKEDVRRLIDIPEDRFVVGHIGRFSDMKNHLFLLDIIKVLRERNSSAFLLMIGEGPLEGKIKDKIKALKIEDSVKILSKRSDIPQLLKAMDVFVFPSLFEGLSVTVVEAQASGLRCIVSDGINKETILTEDTVVVPLSKSAEEWADVILDSTIKNYEYGNLKAFDMNREIDNLIQLYGI